MDTGINIFHDAEGVFMSRPNRFVGVVEISGLGEQMVHVHDPGRLKELLYPGNKVLLKRASSPGRKTAWDLLAARFQDQWVFTNSAYHPHISRWVLEGRMAPFSGVSCIRPEVTVGHSRLDYVLDMDDGKKIGLEVKGCTLAVEGVALFPDAPTERGRRHIETLMTKKDEGWGAALMVLVFRTDAVCFSPKA
ncbi:MAG: DNA/RNA nuclease SfsA, partial [Candidatus Thermoplasmatota archaeon]|nr:DNA/RNA nuclease SfsA [Candidatus Thermoplasmatota archaeon]